MWNPEDYARNSDAQLRWAQELQKNLDLLQYATILDVGCGDGKITANFAETLSRVVGCDSSAEMIAYAQAAYPAAQYPNLTFVCQDGRSLDWQSEFELVFSNATLHWVDDHPAVLRGMNRALGDGGRLVLSCGGEGNAAAILQTFAQLIQTASWQKYFKAFSNPYFFFGITEYEQWLEQCGFKINRLKLVPKDMTHQGQAGLAGWIRTTWMPFTKCVPPELQDDFIAQFGELYLAQYPLDQQGLSHVQMVRLEVDAIKS